MVAFALRRRFRDVLFRRGGGRPFRTDHEHAAFAGGAAYLRVMTRGLRARRVAGAVLAALALLLGAACEDTGGGGGDQQEQEQEQDGEQQDGNQQEQDGEQQQEQESGGY
ncbi:hypothetical protein SAMN04489718_3976 [Actinopolyspora saharensis]|uniref:Uncharacterized protein n=2 Tax=Actinopolyspora saharensis TaxID=995062 RepID=A0A1H1GYH7_9ACTN|nr:hypothetical protein SAMN04489718_3976 [Actinopolyspora saharensis]